jgi:hypothetical protein
VSIAKQELILDRLDLDGAVEWRGDVPGTAAFCQMLRVNTTLTQVTLPTMMKEECDQKEDKEELDEEELDEQNNSKAMVKEVAEALKHNTRLHTFVMALKVHNMGDEILN